MDGYHTVVGNGRSPRLNAKVSTVTASASAGAPADGGAVVDGVGSGRPIVGDAVAVVDGWADAVGDTVGAETQPDTNIATSGIAVAQTISRRLMGAP